MPNDKIPAPQVPPSGQPPSKEGEVQPRTNTPVPAGSKPGNVKIDPRTK